MELNVYKTIVRNYASWVSILSMFHFIMYDDVMIVLEIIS
jgi:hypothetical protein